LKTLITAAEVKDMMQQQEKTLYVGLHSIITPAAYDAAKQYGITIVEGSDSPAIGQEKKAGRQSEMTIDAALIAHIVSQVQDCLIMNKQYSKLSKESDPCGLRLVRGGSVALEDFYIGGQPGTVKMKEILCIKESSQMVSGFMTMEDTVFTSELKNDEINYIISGALTCTINGKKYTGEAGDTFFIPAGTKVTYSTFGIMKSFFVISPN
jgi:ethanolamine utilization protein EutQ